MDKLFNKTKWKPIYVHKFDCSNYLILARINKKTGEFEFKNKKIVAWCHTQIPIKIDTQKVFDDLLLEAKQNGQ